MAFPNECLKPWEEHRNGGLTVITRYFNKIVVKTDRKTKTKQNKTMTWKTEITKVEEHRRINIPPGLLSIKAST